MGMSEPRYHAAVSDHAAMLQYLLTARAEILKANDPNQTPMLHAAAGRGALDLRTSGPGFGSVRFF